MKQPIHDTVDKTFKEFMESHREELYQMKYDTVKPLSEDYFPDVISDIKHLGVCHIGKVIGSRDDGALYIFLDKRLDKLCEYYYNEE